MLRHVTATAYLTPLREGGSLPAVVEADDLGTYVVKFRAAGQGPLVLAAEVIVARLATALGLRVPEVVTVELDAAIGRREPDPEIQDLLVASAGLNLGMDFLPGALTYDPSGGTPPPADEAARIVWLDAFAGNVDRTWRNPNLLVWHRRLWCIDHGAALRFHHAWVGAAAFASSPFDAADHALATFRRHVPAVAEPCAAALTPAVIADAVAAVPDSWIAPDPARPDPAAPADADAARAAYRRVLTDRLAAMDRWLPGGAA